MILKRCVCEGGGEGVSVPLDPRMKQLYANKSQHHVGPDLGLPDTVCIGNHKTTLLSHARIQAG